MKSIDIDFEVYKGMTNMLVSEDDTYNDVIRRLLKLPAPVAEKKNGVIEWMSKGRGFPEGTRFRATFNGEQYAAEIKDGKFVYNGKTFRSFSGAACEITGSQRNGWDFWEQIRPGSNTWIKLY